jgi:hypothetical protein
LTDFDRIVIVQEDLKKSKNICHKDLNAGNRPAARGETIKGKVAQPVVANSKSKPKCYGKNSKTKVMTTPRNEVI